MTTELRVADLPLDTPEGLHGFLTFLLIKASFQELTPQDMRCLSQYVLVMDHLAKRIREEEEYRRYQEARAEPLTVRIVRSRLVSDTPPHAEAV